MPHEPKKRHSRQRQGKRRASIALSLSSLQFCQNCGSAILSHIVCKACGFYNGKQVLKLKEKKKTDEGANIPAEGTSSRE